MQRTSVSCRGLFPVASMGRDHFNPGHRQLFVQRVAVIRLVSDQSFREPACDAFEERFCDKGDFMRRSRRSGVRREKDQRRGAIAMSFVPLPRLVFPTPSLFFSDDEHPVDKTFTEVEFASRSNKII